MRSVFAVSNFGWCADEEEIVIYAVNWMIIMLEIISITWYLCTPQFELKALFIANMVKILSINLFCW